MKTYLSTSRSLELLHMDLFGPTTYKSLGEDKSKTMRIFKIFVKQAQNEFESSVVKVRSDNGTESSRRALQRLGDQA